MQAYPTLAAHALKVRPSGRAVDFVAPPLVDGCGPDCRLAYCRHPRHGRPFRVAADPSELLQAVHRHATAQPWPRLANRVDDRYYTYDLAAGTDVGAAFGVADWPRVLRFFGEHPRAKGAFAVAGVGDRLLDGLPEVPAGKVRVRLRLLPEATRRLLDPAGPPARERLRAIEALSALGYEVDLAFAPLVCYGGWLDDYAALFAAIAAAVPERLRAGVRYEVELLAHAPARRAANLAEGRGAAEGILYDPDLQELVGAGVPHELYRYRYGLRRGILRRWRGLHDRLLPWNRARSVA